MQAVLLQTLVAVACLGFGWIWCFGLAVVDWTAWFLVLPGRKRGSLTQELAPGEEERALGEPIEAVAADGVRLAGIWHKAGTDCGAGRGRTVLVLHGFAEDPSTL